VHLGLDTLCGFYKTSFHAKQEYIFLVKLGLLLCPGLALLQAVTGLALTGTQGHVFAFLTIITFVTCVTLDPCTR